MSLPDTSSSLPFSFSDWVLTMRIFLISIALSLLALVPRLSHAQSKTDQVIVFTEPGFPTADSEAVLDRQLSSAFSGATFANADHLDESLSESSRLLVLPYGSAFPENSWPKIKAFLDKGGNLLVIGGRPFTRAAYRDGQGWHLRDYSVRFIRPLMIDQYQETPGSDGLQFQANSEIPLQVA